MNFEEYMNKEIPTWKKDLKEEYIEQIYNSFIKCINIEKEIEICEKKTKRSSKEQEFYRRISVIRKQALQDAKQELRSLIEEAKKNLGREKNIYERISEALERTRQEKISIERMNKSIKPAEEHGKKL